MKLNLGCGYQKRSSFINLDKNPDVEPDLICDVTKGLPYEDNTADEVLAFDFLEHIPPDKVTFVIDEIYRVLKPGGLFEHFTPSTDGRGAFEHPDHASFWNINSWKYYANGNPHRNMLGVKARFSGANEDVITSNQERIIHTRGKMYAVKDES